MQHPPKKQFKTGRKRLMTVLCIAVLALSAGLVALLPVIREAFPAQQMEYEINQPSVRTLESRPAGEIAAVTIFPDGQNGYTLHMQNGVLMLERSGGLEAIDQTWQQTILETLAQITVQNTVFEDAKEAVDEMEAMGLVQPQCRAVVRYADGTEETMEVGAQVHGSAEYYFRWSGAPGVYICDSGVLETLTLDQKLLLPFEQISITGSLVEEVSIRNAGGECTFSFSGGSAGELLTPCCYPITDETAQTLLSAVSNFRLGAYEARLTDENSALYGFDDPLCTLKISQRSGTANVITEEGALSTAEIPARTLEFVIGRPEGDFFYTCAWQGDVYFISRFLAETLVQVDWQKLISRTPAAMGDQLLTDIVFETAEKTIEVHVTRTEGVLENNQLELDAEGYPVFHTDVTVNGLPVPLEQLELLLDNLNAFTVEGSIPANAVPEQEPRWRITLVTETGEIRVLEGFRLDVFSDAVAVNGVMCHYVYDEAIDVLMTGLV